MTGMKVKARILVLSLVCSAMLLAQTQWSEFSNPKGAFKVLLPGKPVQSSESPATFVLSTATGIYLISYTDAHDGGDAAEIFKNERDSVLSGMNGKVMQEKDVSLAGYRGRSTTFSGNLPSGAITGAVTGEVRLLFNGRRFYMLMAVEPKGSKRQRIAKFLGSFRLMPGATSH